MSKAHRTEKDKKEMPHFERFVTDGNEKADELAKEGAMLDEGLMAQTRAKTVQQEREEVSLAVHSQPPLLGGGMKMLRGTCAAAKRKVDLRGQEKGGSKASDGVVCRGQQVSLHEMWKRH